MGSTGGEPSLVYTTTWVRPMQHDHGPLILQMSKPPCPQKRGAINRKGDKGLQGKKRKKTLREIPASN